MTKSINRSQVGLITSTNAIFGVDEACAMLCISRDAMYRLAKTPTTRSRSATSAARRATASCCTTSSSHGSSTTASSARPKGLAPMAAAGPRGRDSPSPREVTAVRHFMMANLGLSGLPLFVHARIFDFCNAGCDYFESKDSLACFLNVQERSAYRAIRDLLDRGLIEECGVHAPARGHATKRHRIVRERLPPGALANPDETLGAIARKGDKMAGFAADKGDEQSGVAACTPNEMPGKPLVVCHPIRKMDNEDFGR